MMNKETEKSIAKLRGKHGHIGVVRCMLEEIEKQLSDTDIIGKNIDRLSNQIKGKLGIFL